MKLNHTDTHFSFLWPSLLLLFNLGIFQNTKFFIGSFVSVVVILFFLTKSHCVIQAGFELIILVLLHLLNADAANCATMANLGGYLHWSEFWTPTNN